MSFALRHPMTVRQLVDKLAQFPDDLFVLIEGLHRKKYDFPKNVIRQTVGPTPDPWNGRYVWASPQDEGRFTVVVLQR